MGSMFFIGIVSVVVISGLVSFFAKNKEIGVSIKKIILLVLLFAVVISATAFVGAAQGMTNMTSFFGLQVVNTLFGLLAFYLLKRPYFGDMSNSLFAPVLLTLVTAGCGMIGFYFIFNYYSGGDLAIYFAFTVIPFVLPQFVSTSFSAFKSIPQEIYKVWYFPINAEEVDYDNIDTSIVYMMELEYSKSVNDPRLTNTKLRAPMGIVFGDWFRSFVEGYNDRNGHDLIHYTHADNRPMGWIFYVKPSFLGTARFIDPDLTISQNKLTEKNIIIARRVEVV